MTRARTPHGRAEWSTAAMDSTSRLSRAADADKVSKSGGTSAPGRLSRRYQRAPQSMQSVRPHRAAVPVPLDRRAAALAVLAAVLLGIAACSSAGRASGKRAVGGDLSYTVLGKNTKLRLVSDAWVEGQGIEGADAEERRAEFYRQSIYTIGGGVPAVKVCDDEVFGGVVQALDEAGFSRYAMPGSSAEGRSGATQFLELSLDGEWRHFARTAGMTPDAVKAFQTCLSIFGEVFNAVEGYQSGDDSFRFESPSNRSGR